MADVQRFIGKPLGVAWPTDEPLPQITGPLPDMIEQHFDQHRAELLAWFDAFPAPGARLDGNDLLAWYGPEYAPVLSLPRIRLDAP
jgi:hypothetical protein